MSTVTLQIDGRSYQVACADGEEAHIGKLGSMIDAKFAAMGANKAPQEVQNFLFASLMLADEVHEASGRPAATASTPAPAPQGDDAQTDKESELRAEIDQLRQMQASLEEERDALGKQLKTAQEEAKSLSQQLTEAKEASDQHDMFNEDVLAARLEALASQAESFAEAFERNAA